MSNPIKEDPPADLGQDRLVAMCRRMRLIHEFENAARRLFEGGELPGFLHLSLGQEAIPVGTCTALRPDDYITSTHRGHGDVIAKGSDVKYMFAELFGRATGYCRGKGGSMHIADFSQGIIGANGIVSAGLPIAAGVGLSIKMRGTDQVVVCFFGDGATAEGNFHEALNLASLWQVPVVFVCQNNQYAVSNPWEKTARNCDLPARAATYDMPAESVDGMDPIAVFHSVRTAVDRAREDGGPSFIEARTYRMAGHFVGDAASYRPAEERDAWQKRDPIRKLSRRLHEWGYLTDEEEAQIEADIQAEIEAGIEFARSSPIPAPEEALENLYMHFDYQGNPLPVEGLA